MNVDEFVKSVPNFAAKNHPGRIKAFGWFLHTERNMAAFSTSDMTKCYREAHLDEPSNMRRFLDALAEKKPPELLRSGRSFRLSQPIRATLDNELGKLDSVVIVEKMLSDLPGKIADAGERLFLNEALTCYRHSAFRAAIVMVWNLAYDHVARWVLADPNRLAEFNSGIGKRNSRKGHIVISNRDDFEELKEDETIDILGGIAGVSPNVKKTLKDKLGRRNMYAHPSTLTITRAQVDDMITDLVNNVVLYFKF